MEKVVVFILLYVTSGYEVLTLFCLVVPFFLDVGGIQCFECIVLFYKEEELSYVRYEVECIFPVFFER